MKKIVKVTLLSAAFALQSCDYINDLLPDDLTGDSKGIELKNYSKTPNFLSLKSGFEDVKIYSYLSSEDVLEMSPDFVYGSMADGAGLLKDGENFTFINNIEADYSIARITFDKKFKPVKGQYILNAEATANTAQCSGSLITPAEHGFGPLYLSGGEWGGSSKGVFLTDPYKSPYNASSAEMLPAFGQWSTENAVVLNKKAFPGKTVALIGDDQSNNDVPKGQLAMYVGNHGDLYGGDLYGLKVLSKSIKFEVDMKEGQTYDVEFVKYDQRTLDELQLESEEKGIMGFSRVEDIDWRRGGASNNREFYFAVTGRKKTNLIGKGTVYGRIYKVVLDKNNPLYGRITCVLDGDVPNGKAKAFHSPDNVLVTENYVYIQEDPNGYFDNADKQHYAQLYQYNINTGELKTVLECDQDKAASLGYGTTNKAWEITGMIDISGVTNSKNTFALITQNHGWEKADGTPFTDPAANADVANSRKEGSHLYIIKGLER